MVKSPRDKLRYVNITTEVQGLHKGVAHCLYSATRVHEPWWVSWSHGVILKQPFTIDVTSNVDL